MEICRLTLRLRFADPLFWLILGTGLFFLWVPHIQGRAVAPPVPLFGSFGEQMFGAFAVLHLAALILFALASRFDVEQRNLGEVSLTLPVDRAAWVGGWLLAMVIASTVFQAVGSLTNLALQAHYLPQAITVSGQLQADLLAWFEPLVLGTMVLAVCCLIGSKRKAAFVVTLLWIAKVLVGRGGEPLTLLSPGWMPSIGWSDFTGFELGLRHWGWYALYWFAVTCVLLIVAARAGKQGPSPVSVKRSVAALWWPAGIPAFVSIMLAFLLYFPSSRFGRANTHAMQARYERLYRHTADAPQPRLVGIAGQVAIDSPRGVATGALRYTLKNDTHAPIRQFNLDWMPVSGYKVSADGCDVDGQSGFARCVLSKPLAQGTSRGLNVHVRYHHAFGTDESVIGYVTHSATLLKPGFFPLLGYDPMKEIQDARDRSLAGLRGLSLVDLDAKAGIRASVFHAQAPLKINIRVRPIRGQTIIAPRDKVAGVTALAIVAGTLEATKTVMADGVAITLYHHRLHTAMLPLIAQVSSSAIRYGVKNYGPLDTHAIRLVEVDMRRTSGTCFSDTLLLSEGIVFNSHAAAPWGHHEDVPSATVGHEIAHLWWAGQVVPARTPGFAVITESFAQYMSLMLRMHAGGKFAQDRMFEDASARFKRYMKTDPDPAIVLSSMHDIDALAYGRGLVVMSIIERIIGEEALNGVLRQFRETFDTHDHPGKFATLGDFRMLLADKLSREEKHFVDPLFDTNTTLTSAQWKKLRSLHRQHLSRSRTNGTGDAHDP